MKYFQEKAKLKRKNVSKYKEKAHISKQMGKLKKLEIKILKTYYS